MNIVWRTCLSACVGVLVSGCALTTLATKRVSWPVTDGVLVAEGVVAPLQVHRDDLGVPHIRGESPVDAVFGLGLVHAQDRAFQADFSRRLAYGRLSGVIGEAGIEYDTFMAGLFLGERANELIEGMPAEERSLLASYVAGFNQGLASLRALPVEYRLLGLDFEPWTEADTLAIVFLNSLSLSENLSEELAILTLRERVSAGMADALYRTNPPGPPIDEHYEALRDVNIAPFSASFRAFRSFLGAPDPQASNNWVVGPSRSADGMPVLANDPHLSQSVPSIWYVADVAGGDLHAAGGTLPGAPFVVIGHNERVAWGFTNLMADYIDLPVLEITEDGGYVLAGERREFERRSFEIHVRDEPQPRQATAVWTKVGPLITTTDGDNAIAFRWHVLELPDQTVSMFHRLQMATTVDDVMALGEVDSMLSLNLVVADVDGHYGWSATGSVPVRLGHSGRIPYFASEPGSGWDGTLGGLPSERDPLRGFVLSANASTGSLLDDQISSRFVPDWRQRRIAQVLLESEDHTVEDSEALHQDRLDLQAAALVPPLMGLAVPSTPSGQLCRELLLAWDFHASPDAVGPTVWAAAKGAILREALVDELGVDGVRLYLRVWGNRGTPLDTGLAGFTDNPAQTISRGLTTACESLAIRYGDDPSQWTWGEPHQLHLRHPFGGRVKMLSAWNMRPVPWGGSAATVNAAAHSLATDDWSTGTMASMRLVVPLSDPGAATIVHPGGQSGQPGHPNYASHYEAFVAGDTLPLWFDDDDVQAHTVDTLVIMPRSEN